MLISAVSGRMPRACIPAHRCRERNAARAVDGRVEADGDHKQPLEPVKRRDRVEHDGLRRARPG